VTDRLDAPGSHERARRRPVDDPYSEDGPLDDAYDGYAEGGYDRGDGPDDGPDLGSLLPARVRAGIDRLRAERTGADTLALTLVAVHLLVTGVAALRGSFHLDDLTAQVDASGAGLGAYVTGTTHGFAPAAHLIEWLQVRLFPLAHGPVVVLTLAVRLLLGLVAWRLLRRIFGSRPLTVVPLAVLLLTPALLPATLWYDRLLTAGIATLATLWALEALVRWTVTRRRAALVQVGLAAALGAAAAPQSAVLPVTLLLVALLVFGGGRGAARDERYEQDDAWAAWPAMPPATRAAGSPATRAAVRGRADRPGADGTGERRPALLGAALSAVVTAPFLAVQLATTGTPASAGDTLAAAGRVLGTALSMLVGGPWRWTPADGTYAAAPDLALPVRIAVVLVVGALVAAVLVRESTRRGGQPAAVARGLLLAAGCLVASAWCALTFTTGAAVSTDVALLPDRWATLVPGLLLGLSLVLLPWAVGVHAVPARSVRPDGVLVVGAPVMAAGLVALVAAVGAGVSTVGWVGRWWENPTGSWLAGMRASIATAEPYARVLATPLPVEVLPTAQAGLMPTGAPLLRMVRPDLRFHDGDGTARFVNDAGVLTPVFINPIGRPAGTPTGCVKLPRGENRQPLRVRLAAPTAYRPGAQVQVGLLLTRPSRVGVQVETPDGRWLSPPRYADDELPSGAHTLHLPLAAGTTVVAVRVATDGAGPACLAAVQIWAPLS
jgi:hypothetical protein